MNRTGLPIRGVPNGIRQTAQAIPALGIAFPELFFFFVLGGEDPIDYVQRRTLNAGNEVHPLLERIMRIHVAEEARHLSFARHYLRRRVPELGPVRRRIIGIAIPMILYRMSKMMLGASRSMVREFRIPEPVLAEAYRSPQARAERRNSLAKVRELADELGLVTPSSRRLWKAPPSETGTSPAPYQLSSTMADSLPASAIAADTSSSGCEPARRKEKLEVAISSA